ncbi:hypothetical protein [Novosphingobium sp. ST904]|uniref:hypothetical protein n=2 Tax=unclassified Novosphingobium TaxID=2644732 RepID=UPI000AA8654E|nr:hypothetical protein [Novosphingobium sp. ST904]TCM26164.1 hypothetical protein EDF59_13612 [Novosphingobium sp. ST904]
MASHLMRSVLSVVTGPGCGCRSDVEQSNRAEICQIVMRMRYTATKLLGNVLSSDPYWDAILDLYLAGSEERSVYQSAICIRELSQPSAHRLASRLEKMGAVIRTPDAFDCRRRNLVLTEEVRQAIDEVMDLMVRNIRYQV